MICYFFVEIFNVNNVQKTSLDSQTSSRIERNPCDIDQSMKTKISRKGDADLNVCERVVNETLVVSRNSVDLANEKHRNEISQSNHSIQTNAIISRTNIESHNISSAITNTVIVNQTNPHEYAKDEIPLNETALYESKDCPPNVCKDVKTDLTNSVVSTTNSITGTFIYND